MIPETDETLAQARDRAVRTIRGIAMDAPAAARSGHPGTAMALAPLIVALYGEVLRHDPEDPDWFDRDRFVLSCGHASILQYAALHLAGYDLSLEDLTRFRQLGSATPGHPEVGRTPGIEVTTGPLGQGLANAVGMALAERYLRSNLGACAVDHRTWVIASDGDLEEGISHEAASFAGHQRLDRLCVIYDDNRITIDGATQLAFSDDTARRFEAYGWHVVELGEIAEDIDALVAALEATRETDAPSLLILRSHIGFPSPNMTDRKEAHGSPFSADEIAATKAVLGLDPTRSFEVLDGSSDAFSPARERGASARAEWAEVLRADPATLERLGLLIGWVPTSEPSAPSYEVGSRVATRKASAALLADAASRLEGLMAGGADLTENTGTLLPDAIVQSASNPEGRQLHFGVREFAMGAIMNGMALHGGVIPVGATFFVFSDYLRPAARLAALSGAPSRFVFSHDSIGVGEDGPTHQPIEHLLGLRSIPGLSVVRPADANETVAIYERWLFEDGPSALVTSRQDLRVLAETAQPAFGDAGSGAYVLIDCDEPDVTLLGTGSEVELCVDAASLLAEFEIRARVVSMPCWEWFDEQEAEYQERVLGVEAPVISVEAATTLGWDRYADIALGVDDFGTSAPAKEVFEYFGLTPQGIVEVVREVLAS